MRILVIDRDRMATQFLRSRIEGKGHELIEETVKNNAIELLGKDAMDAVFFDPAPLANARPLVLGIRRTMASYPYVVLMSHSIKREDAIRMGANDILTKPLDGADVERKIDNARRLVSLVKHIADDSVDFPSAGGIIAKSAFNQLFRSAIDRADRYGERAHVLFISLENYQQIRDLDGPYAAEYIVSKLAQQLARLRRQSDIISQIDVNEYALLLQRPQHESEPIDAAKRFAQSLSEYEDIIGSGSQPVDISVKLVDLPVGNMDYSYRIDPKNKKVLSAG